MRAIRAIPFLLLLLTFARAEDPQLKGPGLTIGLISEDQTIAAGSPFTIGLHIHHLRGFHTYWKNPGLVGVETSLKWTLPPGFTASQISWPFPEKTFMSQYPCHGYERDVTLLVTITPPKTISASSVTLSAEAAWMCCAKGCFPGFKTLEITLPVGETPVKDPTAVALIKKSRTELPKTTHPLKCTLLSAPEAKVIRIQIEGLKPESLSDLSDFYFFSSDRQVSSDQKQTVTHHAEGSVILSVPRSEYSPKGGATLPGVLAIGPENFAIEATASKK